MMQKTWSWSTTGYSFVGKPHETIREICKAAGLAGIEGAPELFEGKTDSELEAIGKEYRAAGLRVETFHLPFTAQDDLASFYETSRRQAVERARLWIERAAILGATVGICHPTTNRYNVDVEGLDNYLRQLGKSLETLLRVAEALGFTIALENMLPSEGGRLASRPEHFEMFARQFKGPNLGFCLDTGHALVAGGPGGADEFYAVMAPHIVAFHLADNAGDRDSHLAPGHGLVDWTAFFRRTAELRYSRSICIETPPFAHGPNYGLDAWRGMVADTEALVEKAFISPKS
jgi:sugar phosphate isomerase/epimerase